MKYVVSVSWESDDSNEYVREYERNTWVQYSEPSGDGVDDHVPVGKAAVAFSWFIDGHRAAL